MVIEDSTHFSNPKKTPAVGVHWAAPTDRVASFIIDAGIVLPPPVLLGLAPFKREMLIAVMRSDQAAFVLSCIVMALLCVTWFLAYQIFCLRRWHATLGQKVLRLRVSSIWNDELSDEAIVIRSLGLLASIFCLGLPCLGILGNSRRRAFHDRLSDSMVANVLPTGLDPQAMAPTRAERTLVRSIYGTLIAGIVLGLVVFCDDLPKLIRHFDVLDDNLCSDVTSASEGGHQSRIALAHELFAANLIDAECLKQEAYNTIYNTHYEKNLGYLALAMVYESEPEIAQKYAAMVCEHDTDSEACQIVHLLRSEELREPAELVLLNLSKSQKPFARVWAIRSSMRAQKYDEALQILSGTHDEKNLAAFFMKIRTQAYFALQQVDKAELTAQIGLEVLPMDQAADLASFMCFEQLETTCRPAHNPLCDWLFSHANEDASTSSTTEILARFRVRECTGDRNAMDELALPTRRDLARLHNALELMHRHDKNAFVKLETLLYDSESAPLRREIARQWIRSSEHGEDIESLADYAKTLPQSHEKSVLVHNLQTAFHRFREGNDLTGADLHERRPASRTIEDE